MTEQEMCLSRRKEQFDEKVNQNQGTDSEPLEPVVDRTYPFAVVLRLRVLQQFDEKVNQNQGTDSEPLEPVVDRTYPFAVVLRLRVLQIVCGIAALIMGTVAFIEEKGQLNLGLGIPAGGATIIAAAASIYTSRGFEGYRTSSCMPASPLRFLGPSFRIGLPLAILWSTACCFQTALIVHIVLTLTAPTTTYDHTDLVILSVIELTLAAVTIAAVLVVLRIDCKYDPD